MDRSKLRKEMAQKLVKHNLDVDAYLADGGTLMDLGIIDNFGNIPPEDPTFRTLILQYLRGVAPGGRASSPERKRQSILRATEGFAIAPASANQQIV